MKTMTFAQAQFAYDNMTPDDFYGEEVDVQYEFDEDFKGGMIVMTPDGTGIVTGEHVGAVGESADEDGVYSYTYVASIEVAVPGCGKEFYNVNEIQVRKDGKWVDV
jgi:hypothetical protein